MRKANTKPLTGSIQKLAARGVVAITAFLVLISCGNTPKSALSVVLGPDVVIEGIYGQRMALTTLPRGGFVVAGYSWAVATDANGGVIWRYADPETGPTPNIGRGPQFHGVVPLSNGNILLCGQELYENDSAALLTILDSAGRLVEKRLLKPPEPEKYGAVRFERCLRWDDGVAVIGSMAGTITRYDWLMKLDGNGTKQWDLFDYQLAGSHAVETVNHNLIMASFPMPGGPDNMKLVQVNPRGHLVSTKELTVSNANMVRSGAPTSTLKVLTDINRKDTAVLTLNDKFEGMAPPWRTQIPVTGDGFAWMLWDGSLAVFDHVFAQGADRACVSRIRSGEHSYEMLAFPLPNPQSRSDRLFDAVPISEKTFVAVRSLNNSVALSWVTFK
jgi:hypothetical protein